MNVKSLIPLALLLAACNGGGSGDGSGDESPMSDWEEPVRLSPAAVDEALEASVAIDADGNALAVWFQALLETGPRSQVGASYLIPGQDWGMPEAISGADSYSIAQSKVQFDGSGNAIAIWFQVETNPSDRGLIRTNRYLPGIGWGTAETLQEFPSRENIAPKLAVTPAGDAVAVWGDPGQQTVWTSLYFSASGWEDPEPITDSIGKASAASTDLAIDDSGSAIVVWQQHEDIMTTRYNGTAWSAPVHLEGSLNKASHPKVGLDYSGNGIALWQAGNGEAKIYFNLYTPADGWSEPQLLAPGSAPELGVGANGKAVAIWYVNGKLQAAAFSPASGWSDPEAIDSGDSTVDYARIAVNDSGNAFVVWRQPSGGQPSIWANHYVSGDGWKQPMLVERQDTAGAYRPAIAIDNDNNAVAVWDEFPHAGHNEVWASRNINNN